MPQRLVGPHVSWLSRFTIPHCDGSTLPRSIRGSNSIPLPSRCQFGGGWRCEGCRNLPSSTRRDTDQQYYYILPQGFQSRAIYLVKRSLQGSITNQFPNEHASFEVLSEHFQPIHSPSRASLLHFLRIYFADHPGRFFSSRLRVEPRPRLLKYFYLEIWL